MGCVSFVVFLIVAGIALYLAFKVYKETNLVDTDIYRNFIRPYEIKVIEEALHASADSFWILPFKKLSTP